MPSTGRSASAVPRGLRAWMLALAVVCAALSVSLQGAGTPAAASTAPATSAAPDHADAWDWPVEGPFGSFGPPPTVLRGFDPPDQPWLPGHRGVDLAAAAGAVVDSAGDGVVVFAGPLAGRGVVSVEHADGLRTTYEPVTATVSVGEPVGVGDPVGTLEPLTSHCGQTCLHWGLKRDELYLDPLSLVRPLPPVLLPYGPPVQRLPLL